MMGVHTWVEAYKPPSEQWLSMKAAYDACVAAGVDAPDEVMRFFDYEPPEDQPGERVEFRSEIRSFEPGAHSGHEVCLADLPEGVTHVRFVISW
jgi:hypothetical protein